MRIIDIIDNNSKIVSEVTGITKGVIAKDPDALNTGLIEYLVKNHLGEPMYDTLQKLYKDYLSSKNAATNPQPATPSDIQSGIQSSIQPDALSNNDVLNACDYRNMNCQDVSGDVNVQYIIKNEGD